MKNIFALLLSALFILPAYAQEEGLIRNYIHLGKSEGISSNNVKAIHDDIYGRLWIGTETGLDIYCSNALERADRFSATTVHSLFNTGREMLIGTTSYLEAYNYDLGTYSRIQYNNNDIPMALSVFHTGNRVIIISEGTAYQYADGTISQINTNIPCNHLDVDKFGVLWGFNNDKVYRFDDHLNIVKTYNIRNADSPSISITCMYPDSKGCVWLGTERDGLYRYNRVSDNFYRETLSRYGIQSMGKIGSINEDKYDRLWIGHNNGLSVYDYTNNFFKYYILENSHKIQLMTTITDIFRTHDNEMVIGTRFSGFFYINEIEPSIKFHTLNESTSRTGGVTANAITRDDQGLLWVSTNNAGINVFDSKGKITKQFNERNANINNNVISLGFDGQGNIWAGTASAGLYRLDKQNRSAQYTERPNDSTSISGMTIYSILPINNDSLLVATNNGVDIYLYRRGTFTRMLPPKNKGQVFNNLLAYENKIYGTGQHAIFCLDRTSGSVTEYSLSDHNNITVQTSYIDRTGRLWLGTSGGEIYYFENGKPVPFVTGRRDIENISNIQGDDAGNLWVTTGNNLLCITPSGTVKTVDLSWSLGNNEFNTRSVYKDYRGNIYLGASNGLLEFAPVEIMNRENRPPTLYISDFKLFDEPVIPGESPVLKKHINNTGKLVLEDSQNFISFTIRNVDYNTNRTVPYKCVYKLENFDDRWYNVNPASSEIVFNRLLPGSYNLIVKLETNEGVTLATKRMNIVVNPHFLLSAPMILLYLMIIIFLVWWLNSMNRKKRAQNEKEAKTTAKNEEEQKFNTMKLDLISNLSGELKAPLTTISTLQDELLPFVAEQDEDMELFRRNVKRLEYLTEQLVEFRNLESGQVKVIRKKYDLIPLLQDIYSEFDPLYKRKKIESNFLPEQQSLPAVFDSDKFEVLIGNLLSNTVRHTRKGGNASLKVYTTDDEGKTIIDIFNSGACLTVDQQESIFEPYHPVTSGILHSGSGMGLALSSSIAKLLNMELIVIPIENEGNIFRIVIPAAPDDDTEMQTVEVQSSMLEEIIENTVFFEDQNDPGNGAANARDIFQVLLVDNEDDDKDQLEKVLQVHFQTSTASDAQEVLQLLKTEHIDVIISDVDIPETDGYELCKAIKANSKTKHIPVILITSQDSAEAKIKGFQAGADAFMPRPVNIQELLLRLDNILRNKDVLQAYYASSKPVNNVQQQTTDNDDKFMKEVTDYIYNHLSDAELSVQQLAEHINISRTQLYLNIKRLTGQTPSMFVLNIKMKQAKKLMLTTGMTSADISNKLGYCNPNHFSRQFKDFYGISPSEFRKQQNIK